MSANTKEDEVLKVGLIDDTMTLINIEGMYQLILFQTQRRLRIGRWL
jgi:hypothetical protein